MIDFARFFSLTVRARVAFVEQVARAVLQELDHTAEGFEAASSALDLVAAWRQGVPVDGNALNDKLMNSNDEGVFAYVDARVSRSTDHVYNTVGAAVSYAAWHAYRAARQPLPEGIEEISEDSVLWLFSEAERSPLYQEEDLLRILDRLLEQYPAQGADELGAPVFLE